jgi:cysteine desulfurase
MAAELAWAHLEEYGQRVAALRDRLERNVLELVPQVSVNGDRERRLPNTSNLSFECVEGEGFVIAMDLKGFACSTGAACSSGSVEPSHVLSAIGCTPEQARSSIRFSLGRYTTEEDIDATLATVPAVVERLRAVSPRYKHVGTRG